MRIERAKYEEAILPEHNDNPFILALPKKKSDSEVIEALSFYPEIGCVTTISEPHIRKDFLVRLEQLVQPMPEYLNTFRFIERALKQSYSSKNPFSPSTMSYLHYLNYNDLRTQPSTGAFNAKGTAISIIGESGIGKSIMLERILSYYPQVIQHKKFKGKDLNLNQILWLKVDCPHDGGLKGLCHSILNRLGECTGINYKPDREVATLQDQIEVLLRSNFVGVLVIDEVQRLTLAKTGGAGKFLSFIVKLINTSGIVIVFCGNPELSNLFKREFRNARRAESGGYIEMRKMQEDMWDIFIEELWYLQWTSKKTPLTPKLRKKLYFLSDGIVDIAVRTFKEAQEIVIGSSSEIIDEDILDKAHQRACPLTKDLMQPESRPNPLSLLTRKSRRVEGDIPPTTEKKSKARLLSDTKDIPAIINRCPHDEFSEKVIELTLHPSLNDIIVYDHLLMNTPINVDSIVSLKNSNTLLSNPLEDYGYV